MVRHDQACHDFALDDMALHDFRHVGFGFDAVPHTFRVDDDTRPFSAMVEATGLICTHDVLQIEPLRFLLEMRVEKF